MRSDLFFELFVDSDSITTQTHLGCGLSFIYCTNVKQRQAETGQKYQDRSTFQEILMRRGWDGTEPGLSYLRLSIGKITEYLSHNVTLNIFVEHRPITHNPVGRSRLRMATFCSNKFWHLCALNTQQKSLFFITLLPLTFQDSWQSNGSRFVRARLH